MNTLIFDTETTGKADFNSPPDAVHQPRIVQIGAILFDDQWRVRAELNVILQVDVPIPAEASAIHGITEEIARACGIMRRVALESFAGLVAKSNLLVAHNLAFDLHVTMGEMIRMSVDCATPPGLCTMLLMTPICKLPDQQGSSDYKWPKLEEAYWRAFNRDLDSAHDAMAEVRACAAIYFWLKQREKHIDSAPLVG